jgi:hypothetical protein
MTQRIPGVAERRQIAAREIMPERSVLRAYRDPARCRPATVARVTRAAVALGLPAPQAQPRAPR